MAVILTVSIFTKPDDSQEYSHKEGGSIKGENISLIADKEKPSEKRKHSQKREVKTNKDLPVKESKPQLIVKQEPVKKEPVLDPEPKKPAQITKAFSLGKFLTEPEYCSLLRNGQEIEINEKTEILNGDELQTSFESKVEIQLSDGSKVVLEESTRAVFTAQKVLISSGAADFNITKQKKGSFQVYSGGTVTTVVGTQFSVKYKEKASLVKVSSGIVKVKNSDHEVTLTKGQGAFSRDGGKPQKRDYSEQFGVLAARWTADQIGAQIGVMEFDVSDYINSEGYHDFYFKKTEDNTKGMLQVFKVELYEDGKLIAVDEHNGVTSNHTTELRNRNVWLHGGYGSSMYRFYLKKHSSQSKYVIKVRNRSFKGSCPGEIWLLSTVPTSETLIPGVIPKGKNLAYRKKTTTKNPGQSQNHGPEMVVDNKITPQSSWWGAGSTWVQIDLGKETEFNSCFVVNFWEQNCYHQYFIEVSSDGQQWKKVIDMTENTLPAHETGQYHRFPTVTARYIRMTVNKVRFSQGGISVVELKVLNMK